MRFTKMHGCGNDFIIVQTDLLQHAKLTNEAITDMAKRRTGIGFDQMLLLTPTADDKQLKMEIINADGTHAYQCGNGLRCAALYCDRLYQTHHETWTFHIGRDAYEVTGLGHNQYQATLGIPKLHPHDIPFIHEHAQSLYTIHSPWGPLDIGVVNVGNPHAVWCIDGYPKEQLDSQVRFLAGCNQFPEGVNINTITVKDDQTLLLHVYERGSGWTQACGSGACASTVVALQNGWINGRNIKIIQPGGTLMVSWPGDGHPIQLTGEAAIVYDGIIEA